MADVWAAVEAFVPWYSSVHRGSGAKSQVSTAAFEEARDAVATFVGARADDEVVFVRNTTEAINVMAAAMPAGARILSSPVEHHANMLPWRRHDVRLLPFTSSAAELVDVCARALRETRFDLLAVTGASNVTGEIWPVTELAEVAHRHGADLFVDAAQLAPHRAIDMAASGIDHLALSGHKLYAPFGAGALVAASRRLSAGAPLLRGGGAVKLVTLDDVVWEDAPERHEAGSPDVVGVVALAAACRRLHELGMDTVAGHERALAERLWHGLEEIRGLRVLRLWPGATERAGMATFTLDRIPRSTGRRDPERRARDRRPPRLLLRPSAHDAAAGRVGRRSRPLSHGASGGPASGASRSRARQRRPRDHRRRHRPPDRRAARAREPRAAMAVPPPDRARRVRTGRAPRRVTQGPAGRGGPAVM